MGGRDGGGAKRLNSGYISKVDRARFADLLMWVVREREGWGGRMLK